MNLVSRRSSRQFGDFQTPAGLAANCCRVIDQQLGDHDTVVEPTCGRGRFLLEAINQFRASQFIGFELNTNYVRSCRRAIKSVEGAKKARVHKQNFFEQDWNSVRAKCGERVLFLGNPPWVTSAEVGLVGGDNLPSKTNSGSLRGLDAVTGKANFDLSESVIRTLLAAMRPGRDSLAMLVKGATVRRVADEAWKHGYRFGKFSYYRINAKEHFGASVEAGMMLLKLTQSGDFKKRSVACLDKNSVEVCRTYRHLSAKSSTVSFGSYAGNLVRKPKLAKQTSAFAVQAERSSTQALISQTSFRWRSGVKHDLSRVLELSLEEGDLINRDGIHLDIEPEHVFPLAKGSDVASGANRSLSRAILIPQRSLGQSTLPLQGSAPKTFAYLNQHRVQFDGRRSSIYRGQDPFAIFGVGDYTFSQWKVAICGLYKRLTFTAYGPVKGKPVIFDDTTYLLPCRNRAHATLVKQLLDSESATKFFDARIFWDAKRPITSTVLRTLDLQRVAEAEGLDDPCQA